MRWRKHPNIRTLMIAIAIAGLGMVCLQRGYPIVEAMRRQRNYCLMRSDEYLRQETSTKASIRLTDSALSELESSPLAEEEKWLERALVVLRRQDMEWLRYYQAQVLRYSHSANQPWSEIAYGPPMPTRQPDLDLSRKQHIVITKTLERAYRRVAGAQKNR